MYKSDCRRTPLNAFGLCVILLSAMVIARKQEQDAVTQELEPEDVAQVLLVGSMFPSALLESAIQYSAQGRQICKPLHPG